MSQRCDSPDLPRLPPRQVQSHKGNFGRALLVGGSRGMTGAITLSGLACLRSGAGLVTLAIPDVCQHIVSTSEPSLMTVGLPSDSAGRISVQARQSLSDLSQHATCIGCGPGLGRSPQLDQMIQRFYRQCDQPLVVDADGLNALSTSQNNIPIAGGQRILTPHLGEYRRLTGLAKLSMEDARDHVMEFARQAGIVVILKGTATLITDGTQTFTNATGNPGMATGGSGDVLTGVLVALVCQGLSLLDAARLGTHVHGLAGDLAAKELGEVSLIASDLIHYLPSAWLSLK